MMPNIYVHISEAFPSLNSKLLGADEEAFKAAGLIGILWAYLSE